MATAEFYKFAGILSAALSQHHLSGFGIAPLYLLLWAGIPQKKWSSHHGPKRVQNAVLGCNLKNDRMISVHFQSEPFNITVIQVYAPTSNTEEAEVEEFYEDLQDLFAVYTLNQIDR